MKTAAILSQAKKETTPTKDTNIDLIRQYSVSGLKNSLIDLINEQPTDTDDDQRRMDWFHYDLSQVMADVAINLAFKKQFPEVSQTLISFLWTAIDLFHPLNRGKTVKETVDVYLERVISQFGPITLSKNFNRDILQMHQVCAEVAFDGMNKDSLVFIGKFFIAFKR